MLDGEERRLRVDRHDAVEVGLGDVVDGRRLAGGGVVDQDVQAAETVGRGVEQGADGVEVTLVGPDGVRGAATGPHRLDDGVSRVVVALIAEHDLRAVAGQPLHDGPSDAAGPAGDQRGLAAQRHQDSSSTSAVAPRISTTPTVAPASNADRPS